MTTPCRRSDAAVAAVLDQSGSVRAVAVFTGSGGRALLATVSDDSHTSERKPETAPGAHRASTLRTYRKPALTGEAITAVQVEPYVSHSTAPAAEHGR